MEPIAQVSNSEFIASIKRVTPGSGFINPLEDIMVDISFSKRLSNKVYIEVYDSKNWCYYSKEISLESDKKKQISERINIKGSLGIHRVKIHTDSGSLAELSFEVDTFTRISTDSRFFDHFYDILSFTVKRDSSFFRVNDRWIRCNPTWIRDHIHEMKGYKYWETDIKSYIEHILDLQMDNGAYYDFISVIDDPHRDYVDDKWKREDKENGVIYIRIPVEADLEYLLVEGAYTVWQVTGDNEWIKRYLPKLEKGLLYSMSDPLRWDEKYQLVKRPFTIDTWDFTNYLTDDLLETNRKIRELSPSNPFCIMHGDNSGMFEACYLLSRIYESLGDMDKSRFWREKAEHFKVRTNELCWNGRFYTHQIHLDPQEASKFDESERLSLSNAYDINRGIADHDKVMRIIEEYITRWERDKKTGRSFAEWYSIDPPYERFSFYRAGEYINGGILTAVGGELAKAAFKHGFEEYAIDILKRFAEKVQKDGFVGFLYTNDGKDMGGGPPGWGAAAFISALIEGLAGIEDNSILYESVVCSPRWIITGEREVSVTSRYGPSDAYFSYKFSLLLEERRIKLEYSTSGNKVCFHVLLPKEANLSHIIFNGREIPFTTFLVERSKYVDFSVEEKGGLVEVFY